MLRQVFEENVLKTRQYHILFRSRLRIAEAWVWFLVSSCGMCDEQCGDVKGFYRSTYVSPANPHFTNHPITLHYALSTVAASLNN
jgi:hypothetical protein